MKITWLILAMSVLPYTLFSQINITKYASDDLFEVKPVITANDLLTEEIEESTNSMFEIEVAKGMALWESNELDDALDYFSVMADDYSNIPLLHYYVGGIYYEKKEYEDAIQSLWEVLTIDPLFLNAKYLLGLIYIENEEADRALKLFDELIGVPVFACYGYYGMGQLAIREGNYAKALRMYKKSIKSDSTFADPYIPYANLEASFIGNVKEAKKTMDQAVAIDSTWQQARIIRGILSFYVDKNLDQFEKDLDILLKQNPSNYHFHSIKGFLNIELQEYRKAVENFRMAFNLEIDSTRAGAYQFSTKLNKDVKMQNAMNYYSEHYGEIDSVSFDLLDRAICKYFVNSKRTALILFDSATATSNHSVAYTLRGVLHENQWNTSSSAIESYTEAIARDSLNSMAYLRRGELFMNDEKFEAAIDDYTTLIKLKPENKMGYKYRGMLFIRRGESRSAIRDFTIAIMLDSTDSDLYFNRGNATLKMGYFDSSIEDFNAVIERKPNDGEVYYLLSLSYILKGDTLKSITLLDSASKIKKYDEYYHTRLIELSNEHNLPETSMGGYNRLVKYYSYKLNYRIERGKIHLDNGDYLNAKKDFEQVINRDEKSSEGYFFLSKVLLLLGDDKLAEKALKKAEKLGYIEED